ncbi:MAG TPA: hypothetical protein VEI01_24840 [Terriglobales bacterium]|nr:hypothetical protein [Terriglobales bacterium]
MKSQMLIVAGLCLAIGLAVVPANAQAGSVQANLPFRFAVLGMIFPAGNYKMIAGSHQVNIEDGRGKIVAMVLANPVSGRSAGKNGQVIFHCYRDSCFLAEVWSPTQENGLRLPTSGAEANLAKAERGKYFAVLGVEPLKRP